MKKENSKKGFTIIEVVLVLAIAGLIFLMVFIALPAMQRGQRDTQRRDDMARFMSQLNQYQSNNKGAIPTTEAAYTSFLDKYLKVGDDTFENPSTGDPYTISFVDCVTTSANCKEPNYDGDNYGVIHVFYGGKCQGETPVHDGGKRKVAITLKLEGSGVYCSNN